MTATTAGAGPAVDSSPPSPATLPESPTALRCALASVDYIASADLATTVYLALQLDRPLLAEGPAGVGKTELAKAVALATNRQLIRLQCYEGLDESRTLYEWRYAKQLLYTQMLRDHIAEIVHDSDSLAAAVERIASHDDAFFSERFLDARPLLRAVQATQPVVLLIDEVDRAADELEAFFLEFLGEFQVTIPEVGTLAARHRPLAILTSNSTRELSDALRRRCVFLGMDYPDLESEIQIIRARVPGVDEALARRAGEFVAALRTLDLKKQPSISETIDWARALVVFAGSSLSIGTVGPTLNLLLKYEGDLALARNCLPSLLGS